MELLNLLNENIVWGVPMLLLFIGSGIFFSLKIGLSRLNIFGILKHTIFSAKAGGDGKNLSPLQTLTASLATTLGTGNIVAIGTAVAIGGAGAVFWMWISALLGMATCYAENVYGMRYRRTRADGTRFGGAFFYIEKVFGRFGGALFAVFCAVSSIGMGNMAQLNAAAGAMKQSFSISPEITGAVCTFIVGVLVFGGTLFLGKVTEKAIPIISALYIFGCLAVIFLRLDRFPEVIARIFSEALGFSAIGGGIFGGVMLNAMSWGVRRGVFSNEAGLGSSVMLYSATAANDERRQGEWAALGVFIDTIIMCSLTAFAILLSGADGSGLDGTNLAVLAFSSVFGDFAGAFVSICIFLFAVSTAAGWAVYGGCSVEYLFGKRAVKPFFVLFTAACYLGATADLALVWAIADLMNGLMAVPNLLALIALSFRGDCLARSRGFLR